MPSRFSQHKQDCISYRLALPACQPPTESLRWKRTRPLFAEQEEITNTQTRRQCSSLPDTFHLPRMIRSRLGHGKRVSSCLSQPHISASGGPCPTTVPSCGAGESPLL